MPITRLGISTSAPERQPISEPRLTERWVTWAHRLPPRLRNGRIIDGGCLSYRVCPPVLTYDEPRRLDRLLLARGAYL